MSFAIAAGHKETVHAAKEVLAAGGNAADAAVAAFLTTWVAEPCMASPGGGAFAHYYSIDQKKAWVLDGFCQTPSSKAPFSDSSFFPIEVDFGDTVEPFYIGYGSTAVPGAVACAFALHERFGSMPMAELAQPAIQLALEGVAVNRFQRYLYSLLEPILKSSPRGRSIYFPKGGLIEVGEKLRMPELADFLDYMSREGKNAFYRGEVARKIAQDYEVGGGHLRLEDLEEYQVEIREPLIFPYDSNLVLTNPTPSLGGAAIAHLLLGLPPKATMAPVFSRNYMEAWLQTQREAWTLLREPEALQASLAIKLDTRMGSTTHLSIVDKKGNAVGLTASNGEGSGYFVDNAGIHLNNMLGESALLPKGFHSWKENSRLPSMMAPTLLLDEKRELMAVLGSGGAGRIATAIGQVACLLAGFNMPLKEAIEAPRLHLDHNALNLEPGFLDAVTENELAVPVLNWQRTSMFFGGVNAVAKRNEAWEALGDHRRDGRALSG